MSTKVDTSRSRWRATSISGLWPDTLSATRCARISSCERRNGGGQACGNAVILREKSGRCWRRGRSICQRIGSSGSIKPTTARNWKCFAEACNEAAPLASRNGRRKSRNVGLGACPNICSCSRMAAGFRWALAFSASAQPCVPLSPSIYPDAAGAAPDLQKIVGQALSCHSADTFSRPRNRNLRIPRADLIMPNTGSTMCLRPRRELYQSPYAVSACIFSFALASAEGAAASAEGAAASGGTGASWCFCRPVAMCGSMPIFSNSSTASLLK